MNQAVGLQFLIIAAGTCVLGYTDVTGFEHISIFVQPKA